MRSCCWCGRLRDVEILSTSGAEGGVKFDLHTLLQAIEGLCVVRITFNSYVVVLEPELGEGPAVPAVGGRRRGEYSPGDVLLVMAAHGLPQPLGERHLELFFAQCQVCNERFCNC